MALIVITIKDQEDGTVAVQLMDEPRCTPDQTEFSAAQHIGAAALNAIDRELKEVKPLIEVPGGKNPKLQVVGPGFDNGI